MHVRARRVFPALFVSADNPEQIRGLCAILLRRNLTKTVNSVWKSLSESTQTLVKNGLLKAVTEEPAHNIRKKIADSISDLAHAVEGSCSMRQACICSPALFSVCQANGPNSSSFCFSA